MIHVYLTGKKYATVDEEYARKQIFAENLRKIELHNYLFSKGMKTFSIGVNRFTDMVSCASVVYRPTLTSFF